MKRQFTTIDGRTVMSNLPQHWGGNDWKITGVDNPLPVGNYVQTESGVWIPQKGSDDGAADVRLTGRNVEEVLDRQITTTNRFRQVYKPIYAKGVVIIAQVFGATGTFTEGEGAGLRVTQVASTGSYHLASIFERYTTKKINEPNYSVAVVIYPGDLDYSTVYQRVDDVKHGKTALLSRLEVYLEVNGTFETDQGIDCEVLLYWIY